MYHVEDMKTDMQDENIVKGRKAFFQKATANRCRIVRSSNSISSIASGTTVIQQPAVVDKNCDMGVDNAARMSDSRTPNIPKNNENENSAPSKPDTAVINQPQVLTAQNSDHQHPPENSVRRSATIEHLGISSVSECANHKTESTSDGLSSSETPLVDPSCISNLPTTPK